MSRPFELASLLLFSTALVAPSVALAQAAPATAAPGQETPPAATEQQTPEQTDVSIPGAGDVVVVGTRNPNITRSTPQVVSILSSADIARTGEGDIAGALGRVTGLSVVGNGFVYVRGLGDRYSSALLNGSPLPSPEPLKRVVPLDLFPTSVIASSLVQKSYSVNFPGEFGGGVINLTTKATPKTPFLSFGGSIGADSRTTGQLGYTYYGSASDWTGFDNGQRNVPPALQAFFDSGKRISDLSSAAQNAVGATPGEQQIIAAQLINGRNSVIQRNKALPPNWTATVTGGKSFDIGSDVTFGVIANAGYSNKWRTRDVIQQTANAQDLSSTDRNYERIITDDHVVVNGLLGLSLEFDRNKLRWTNLYIHDTLKQARLGIGTQDANSPGVTFQEQNTAWFARQLIDTQFVGEFKLTPEFNIDVRGGYANSRRDSPDEIGFIYSRSNAASDPYGALFLDTLNVGRSAGSATIAFSKLNENLWSGGVDLSYKIIPEITATIGYAYSDTNRITERRSFLFQGNSDFPLAVAALRPDLLLEPTVIKYFGIGLVDNEGGNPTFRAKLRNHAGYGQIQADITSNLSINAGVRYETAKQSVSPVAVYTTLPSLPPATNLQRNYWLPAATITYKLNEDMQLRVSASKTIARPQFRELVFQTYYDPESNSTFRGNPQLTDSQLYNAEARYEWYFARDQRLAVAGFYKRIDHPIETYASFDGNNVFTSFANAPRATLYGGEIEAQKYFGLSGLSGAGFFNARRLLVVANYTYTSSKIKVGPNDPVAAYPLSVTLANQLFKDGGALTGQSNHLVNLEFGLEETGHLSQQTFLLSYASKRVTRRGPSGQPDIYEKPGLHLDFVARQGVKIAGVNTEMKLEVRNITGTKYQEYQQSGANTIFYNLYNVGTTATFGLSVNF
jgi:outer membrane receptor protein involved in Fe transport